MSTAPFTMKTPLVIALIFCALCVAQSLEISVDETDTSLGFDALDMFEMELMNSRADPTAAPGNATAAPAANNTQIAGNVTKPVNNTRGPSAEHPTYQKKTGRPTVTSDHQSTTYTLLNSDIFVFLATCKEGFPNFVTFNMEDKRRLKYAMGYSRMFQTNNTKPPFKDISQVVAAKDYTWDVRNVEHDLRDDKTVSNSFSTLAVPKTAGGDLVRPTIMFTSTFLTNENMTETRMTAQVDQFKPSYWKMPYLVMEYNMTTQGKDGSSTAPFYTKLNAKTAKAEHCKLPQAGQNFGGGTEFLSTFQQNATSDGIDVAAEDFAFSAAGNKKNVTIFIEHGVDKYNSTLLYMVYDKFDTSLISHNYYVSLNKYSVSPAASHRVVSLIAYVLPAMAALFVAFYSS